MRIGRLRVPNWALLLVAVISVSALGAMLFYPRTIALRINPRWIGHYTGLGIFNNNTPLGYRFYKFEIDDSPFRHWEIENLGAEFNPVRAYYPDGTLCVVGTCRIEGQGRDMYPLCDDFESATCYRPDGSVASVVKDGSGKALLFYPSGHVQWEMEYEDYERVSVKLWNKDGTLHGVETDATSN